MEEEKLANPDESKKTTLKDAGKGFILLGSAVLLLTVSLFTMSLWQNYYYGLFSGHWHLQFYLTLGLGLLAVGFILVKLKPAESKNPDSQP